MSEDSVAKEDTERFRLKAAYREARANAITTQGMGSEIADELVRGMWRRGYRFAPDDRIRGFVDLPVNSGSVETDGGEKPADTWKDLPKDLTEAWSAVEFSQGPRSFGEELKLRGLKVIRDPEYLKPCAHCGGEAKWLRGRSDFQIHCDVCEIKTNVFQLRSTASEVWNRREPKP